MAEKFDHFLLESFIEDNERVKWCPSVPHCGNAISVDGDKNCEVECPCGTEFYFNCSSQPHSPCSCLMWEKWVRKCKVESDSVEWIALNTKFCPKCHKPVHKNGGCNLVGCICQQPFWFELRLSSFIQFFSQLSFFLVSWSTFILQLAMWWCYWPSTHLHFNRKS